MALVIANSRRSEKTSTVAGATPTMAPSTDHTDGTWSATDCYPSEIFFNSTDNQVWIMGSSGPINLATAGPQGIAGPTGTMGTKTTLTLTYGPTVTWNYSSGYNAFVQLLGSGATLSITNVQEGDYGTIRINQGPTGSNTLNFSGTNWFPYGTHSFSSGASANDVYTFYYDGTRFIWNYNKSFA